MADVRVIIEIENVPDGYDMANVLDPLEVWLQARGADYRIHADKTAVVRENRQWQA